MASDEKQIQQQQYPPNPSPQISHEHRDIQQGIGGDNDRDDVPPVKLYIDTSKAYKNKKFLSSEQGRSIRILCEYEETRMRLADHGVNATLLFFGSARAKSEEQLQCQMSKLEHQRETIQADATILEDSKKSQLEAINNQIEVLKSTQWMCPVYEQVTQLARKLTEWSMNGKLAKGRLISGVSRYSHISEVNQPNNNNNNNNQNNLNSNYFQAFVICTGGGPGFMEAANKGASMVENAQNIGMGISLPFEHGVNRYVSPDLAFEFHYFFTRKFWMVYHCQALVVAPGGVGTLDELFEVLTLKQTCKVQKDLPIVLYGAEFWKSLINWEVMIKFGVISKKDFDGLYFTDSIEEAFNYITSRLQQNPNFEFPLSVEDVSV